MGAAIGLEVAVAAPARLRSLVLGGNNPFEGYPQPFESDTFLVWLGEGTASVVHGIAGIAPNYWASGTARKRWLASDAVALTAARQQRLTEPDLGESSVAAISTPALLYAGERDDPEQIERTSRLMRHASFVSLPGLDHLQAFIRRDMVLPHVLAFLAEMQ